MEDPIVTCSICFDNVTIQGFGSNLYSGLENTTAEMCALDCGHIYHWNCISTWFATTGTSNYKKCPLCQKLFILPPRLIRLYPSLHPSTLVQELRDSLREAETKTNELTVKLSATEALCTNQRIAIVNLNLHSQQRYTNGALLEESEGEIQIQSSPLDLRKPRTGSIVRVREAPVPIQSSRPPSGRMVARSSTFSSTLIPGRPPIQPLQNANDSLLLNATRLGITRARLVGISSITDIPLSPPRSFIRRIPTSSRTCETFTSRLVNTNVHVNRPNTPTPEDNLD